MGVCDIDDAAFKDYATAAATPETFAAYLTSELGESHEDYLNRQGISRLMRLRDLELA